MRNISKIKSINLTGCKSLEQLHCRNNQLTYLDLTSCPALWMIGIGDNQLQLSNLLAIERKYPNTIWKGLGTQNLPARIVRIGETLFSDQNLFYDIYTKYIVIKNNVLAPTSDYTISNGKIRFNNLGTYTIIMTNDAIRSAPDAQARVVVEIKVII